MWVSLATKPQCSAICQHFSAVIWLLNLFCLISFIWRFQKNVSPFSEAIYSGASCGLDLFSLKSSLEILSVGGWDVFYFIFCFCVEAEWAPKSREAKWCELRNSCCLQGAEGTELTVLEVVLTEVGGGGRGKRNLILKRRKLFWGKYLINEKKWGGGWEGRKKHHLAVLQQCSLWGRGRAGTWAWQHPASSSLTRKQPFFRLSNCLN